jgi:uncharacterized pyridoxal phosphate-containing UPF0001 family protein
MDPESVRRNLERVREQIGPDVEILAAVKYVPAGDLPALAEAGIELVGENRAQDLLAKQEAHGDLFTWDFIGQLQSRKVKDVAPNVRLIHSLASDSALRKLEEHPAKEVLIQVNVAGEEGKAGIDPAELGDFIARCPVPVTGLMTMPPFVERPEDNRRHFARLAELASRRDIAGVVGLDGAVLLGDVEHLDGAAGVLERTGPTDDRMPARSAAQSAAWGEQRPVPELQLQPAGGIAGARAIVSEVETAPEELPALRREHRLGAKRLECRDLPGADQVTGHPELVVGSFDDGLRT